MVLGGGSLLLVAAAEACVGEDPPFQPTSQQTDGGGDGNASSSSGASGSSSSSSSGTGSSSSSGGPFDAGPDTDGGPCERTKGFGAPEPLVQLNSAKGAYSVTSLRFARKGFYFSSDPDSGSAPGDTSTGLDIYAVEVANGTFGTPHKLEVLSTSAVEDVSPTESDDGTTIFYSSGAYYDRRLKRGQRNSVEAALGIDYNTPPTTLPKVRAASSRETDPYLAGTRLYFAAADGDASTDLLGIYSVSINAEGLPGNDVVKALASAGENRFPVVAADESELFYSHAELVGTSIAQVLYRATPASAPHTFESQSKVFVTPPGLYVSATELSRDACDLYLSIRDEGGRFRVFVAHRLR